MDYGFERDSLLPLANEHLNRCLRRRAEYSDAVGYSRSLLLSLASPGEAGQALLLEEAVGYWTQHTERCGLDSWLAALGAEKFERGFLGRWAVTGSQDRYVRTATRVVEDLQIRAAHAAVLLLNGGYDSFGEESTLEGLRTFLLQRGVDPAAAERQFLRLTRADTSVFPPGTGAAESPDLSAARWQPSAPSEPAALSDDEANLVPTERAYSDGEESNKEAPSMLESLLQVSGPADPVLAAASREEDSSDDSSVAEAEMSEAISKQVDPYLPPISGFVVCRTKAGLKRLHFVGNCGKAPGVHYSDYVHYGDVAPDSGKWDFQCIHCFGRSGAVAEAHRRSPSLSSGTSSDASSGHEEGAVGAKGASAP